MTTLPRVFIASSSEGLHVAEAVNIKLEADARVKQWDNAFDLSSVTISSLIARAEDTDFAVFVFHRDDKSVIRGQEQDSVRDNVTFELGLFIGSLGLDHCFILIPKSGAEKFRLPTDLAGVTLLPYDDASEDMVDAVTTSCAKIKIALKNLHKQPQEAQPASGATVNLTPQQMQSLQSDVWRLRIDAERAQQEKEHMVSMLTSFFHAVAKPATESEILAWEEGAKATYPTEQRIPRHNVFFVDRDIIIPPLYGSGSVSLIVASGARVYGSDQYGHSSVYFMDGFRKSR